MNNKQISSIVVGLVFQTNHNIWRVKEKGWMDRWQCESIKGRKYSFLEGDIQKFLDKEILK